MPKPLYQPGMKNNRRLFNALFASIVLLFVSCGSGSGGGSLVGYFYGSTIENVGYISSINDNVLNGRTDENGAFRYTSNDIVLFHIGSVFFPDVKADRYITAADMSPTNSIDTTSLNIERLLLSLDENGMSEDGIKISESFWENTTSTDIDIDFSLAAVDFESDGNVLRVLNYPGSLNTTLVSEFQAETELRETIAEVAAIYKETTSVNEFIESEAAEKLSGVQLSIHFTDEYFVNIDRTLWFEFSSSQNLATVTTSSEFIGNSVWSISEDTLCVEFGNEFGCRDVYRSGNIYRFSKVDSPSVLDPVILKGVEDNFNNGFPPGFPSVE